MFISATDLRFRASNSWARLCHFAPALRLCEWVKPKAPPARVPDLKVPLVASNWAPADDPAAPPPTEDIWFAIALIAILVLTAPHNSLPDLNGS